MPDPFRPVIRQGRMYGRGTYDMKGGLVACMAAVKMLVDAGVNLAGDVLVAAVADEEYASIGTADLLSRFVVDGAIVAEPTDMDICLAHKGFIWLEVETHGRAAHGSRFDLGIDAIMRMGRFLAGLETLEQGLRARPPHRLLGTPSLHAAKIHGGTGLSTYAAHCTLSIERRTIPGETEAQAVGEIEEIVNSLSARDETFCAKARSFFVRLPFEVGTQAAIVQTLQQATVRVLGRTPAFVGLTPWTDAALFAAAGVDTVVMGPSGAGAHGREEWVDLESVAQLASVFAETALTYCV